VGPYPALSETSIFVTTFDFEIRPFVKIVGGVNICPCFRQNSNICREIIGAGSLIRCQVIRQEKGISHGYVNWHEPQGYAVLQDPFHGSQTFSGP